MRQQGRADSKEQTMGDQWKSVEDRRREREQESRDRLNEAAAEYLSDVAND